MSGIKIIIEFIIIFMEMTIRENYPDEYYCFMPFNW